jgi:23S rRNA (guanosine2251-2'-O)-methyltransferase
MSATIIIGKHAVKQCMESERHIEKVFVRQNQKKGEDIQQLIAKAKQKKLQVQWLEAHRFDQRFSGNHQGIACITHDFDQASIETIIKERPNITLVLDHIQDPHNFGAICRTAEAFGVRHICYPKNRAVQITPSVVKASAGALDLLSLCKVTNLNQTLSKLSAEGFWIYGASSNQGADINNVTFNAPIVLICGSEDKGISPGLTKNIDQFVHIPITGKTSSLNVSVATGIILQVVASKL